MIRSAIRYPDGMRNKIAIVVVKSAVVLNTQKQRKNPAPIITFPARFSTKFPTLEEVSLLLVAVVVVLLLLLLSCQRPPGGLSVA